MLTFPFAFVDLIDLYEKDYLRFQGRELRVNLHRLDRFKRELGTHTVLTPMEVDRFFHTFTTQQPSTRNRYRSMLLHILKWAAQRELVSGSLPQGLLKLEEEHNERTRRLSPEEQTKLEVHMGEDLKLLFHAALDTGLRKGTLLKLRWKHLSQEGVLLVPGAIQKHRESQRIPLTKRLHQELMRSRELVVPLPEMVLFPIDHFREQWDRVRELAGAQDLHWHDLRGEFASRLSERKVRVEVVSKLLGHTSLKTTQRYLRPRLSDFDEAIQTLEEE